MDYTMLDSGEGQKLERFGSIIVARPSKIAIWPKKKPDLWSQAAATFYRDGEKGEWKVFGRAPKEWEISLQGVRCSLKMTPFGHLGIFPEHSSFWSRLRCAIGKNQNCRVLNLFAYTGLTSIFVAQCGATITHVDASKAVVKWAQKNIDLNPLPEKRVFWVIEDVLSFLRKEVRRKKEYHIIILDPPSFGRGPDGEVFKINENFFELLSLCSQLLASSPSLVLISSHTLEHTPEFLKSLAKRSMTKLPVSGWSCGESFCGEGDVALPSGSFALWNS
ncbi:class I SAM-dependent methyltransferase [Chlamydia sp. 17-3921]|uniref:class I SAM-dependent methyltransferase n=1 Tax=Chlamydia sp. 17-3921 TaxID=2675798 RepID=UPI0019189365|nr:class I SAM-dependent methyltransferase [Chlamydia sp. 17-3921]